MNVLSLAVENELTFLELKAQAIQIPFPSFSEIKINEKIKKLILKAESTD